MDTNTLQALTELANKLGTTAELLWGVLVRQALVSGATDLILYAVCTWGIYALYNKFSFDLNNMEKWDYSTGVIFTGLCLSVMILGFTAIINLTDTITALINPEYWALNKLLEGLK